MQPLSVLKIILIALLAMHIAGCYSHLNQQTPVAAEPARFTLDRVIRDIVYSEAGWPQALRADLYLPQRRGALPVVLMVHGGGWANRSHDDMDDISEELAYRGYAVLNLSYRFAPRFTYPAQLLDMQQALRWISENAELYNFDLERINGWGYSAGAHLAALIAGFDKRRLPAGAQHDLPRLRAVVAGGIPADLRKYDDSPLVKRFLGGAREDMLERYAQASPADHVSADDPAVFLYHGKLDFLVSIDQPRDYYEALTAAGVEAELFMHNWRGHMTMFLFGAEAERRAADFLDRHNRAKPLLAAE